MRFSNYFGTTAGENWRGAAGRGGPVYVAYPKGGWGGEDAEGKEAEGEDLRDSARRGRREGSWRCREGFGGRRRSRMRGAWRPWR